MVFAFASFLVGCVSSRKHEDLKTSRMNLQNDYDQLRKESKSLEEENADMKEELTLLKASNKELKDDLGLSRERYDALDKAQRDLIDRYERMLKTTEEVSSAAAGEKAELVNRLSQQQIELDKKTSELRTLERSLSDKEKELSRKDQELEMERRKLETDKQDLQAKIASLESNVGSLEGDLEKREARVKELEAAINAQEQRMGALRSRLNSALIGFASEDLSLRQEGGRLYVSLSQNLLFKSGSKTINSGGKDALKKLAGVLSGTKDVDIIVEGHTDSDGDDKPNWDLSVMRATSVVEVLTQNGVPSTRVIASGRGEHLPVAANTSSDGKAKNRRIEIILSPKLEELYNIIK